jgi:hypothetical protein
MKMAKKYADKGLYISKKRLKIGKEQSFTKRGEKQCSERKMAQSS